MQTTYSQHINYSMYLINSIFKKLIKKLYNTKKKKLEIELGG